MTKTINFNTSPASSILMTLYALPIIAFEGLSSKVFEHFGRSEHFAVLETDGDRILSVRAVHVNLAPDGKEKNLAVYLADHGIAIVLAGNIGPCMSTPLLDLGIRIYTGAAGTIIEALEMYRAGALVEVKKNRYSL